MVSCSPESALVTRMSNGGDLKFDNSHVAPNLFLAFPQTLLLLLESLT